jgi:hypothetical protein
MQRQISGLFQLVAIERLRNDANITDPTSKLGVFVDPLRSGESSRSMGFRPTCRLNQ